MSESLPDSIAAAVRRRFAALEITRTLSMDITRLAMGEAELTMPNRVNWYGIFNSLHGGLLMTLADTAACIAILTRIGEEEVITTTDMNIRFLAPCLTDAMAEAKIIKFGRSLVPVNVWLRDTNGREVALAQVTYMRLEKIPRR
jgi:uncharacterized protein (TIGR00369 family)